MAEEYAWPALAVGTGHCPARTLSNVFLWFGSEKDTLLSGQLLVSAGRRCNSN